MTLASNEGLKSLVVLEDTDSGLEFPGSKVEGWVSS